MTPKDLKSIVNQLRVLSSEANAIAVALEKHRTDQALHRVGVT
jgi:hypothetical protein